MLTLTQGPGQSKTKRNNKMKIRCEVCGNIGYLQHIGKNYYRVRHYVSSISGKPKFEYHKQSLEYTESILKQNNPSPIDLSGQDTIDPNLLNKGSITENQGAGRLAWLGHWLYEPKVAGSSPVRPTTEQNL